MKTLLQRVREAHVTVGNDVVGRIGRGAVLLVGVEKGDTAADADATARKVSALRCFPGATPMDRTLHEVGGACLVVSQFTLAATLRRGNRPGFDGAEDPAAAETLYERVVAGLRATGLVVETGRFAATMEVHLVNDGPVTFWIEAHEGRVTT
jgi:D-aminoacyl-tRNA deacylase